MIEPKELLAPTAALFAVISQAINDLFVNRRLPTLVKVYTKNVLGVRASRAEADSLLPEAEDLYQKEAFGESVLYSVASLEAAVRNKLDLPVKYRLRDIIRRVIDAKISKITSQQLEHIVQVRNMAAHPSPERRVTKEDAGEVISMVEKLLKDLAEL